VSRRCWGWALVVCGGGGPVRGARRRRSRGQGWPEATLEGLGVDAGEGRRRLELRFSSVGAAPGLGWGWCVAPWSPLTEGVAAARLPRHPFADRVGEHGAFRPRPDGLKQLVDRAARGGGHADHGLASGRVRAVSRRLGLGEAADLAVA
jgi:hypothetical protein